MKQVLKVGMDAKRAFHNFRGLGNYSRTLIEGLIKFVPESQLFLYTPQFKNKRALEFAKKISTPQTHILSDQGFWGLGMPARRESLCRWSFVRRIAMKVACSLRDFPVQTHFCQCHGVWVRKSIASHAKTSWRRARRLLEPAHIFTLNAKTAPHREPFFFCRDCCAIIYYLKTHD